MRKPRPSGTSVLAVGTGSLSLKMRVDPNANTLSVCLDAIPEAYAWLEGRRYAIDAALGGEAAWIPPDGTGDGRIEARCLDFVVGMRETWYEQFGWLSGTAVAFRHAIDAASCPGGVPGGIRMHAS